MIGVVKSSATGDLTSPRSAALAPVDPGLSFETALASLDQVASLGGLGGLPKPGVQTAATFGQLGFFEAGPAPAPSRASSSVEPAKGTHERRAPVDDALGAATSAGATNGPLMAHADGLGVALGATPLVTEATSGAAARSSVTTDPPSAAGRGTNAAAKPATAWEPRSPSAADESETLAGLAPAPETRSRAAGISYSTTLRVSLEQSSPVSGLVSVAIRSPTFDDTDSAALSDAVRALLARHGLVLDRLRVNGRSAGGASGQQGES